jgi:transposase-like protein
MPGPTHAKVVDYMNAVFWSAFNSEVVHLQFTMRCPGCGNARAEVFINDPGEDRHRFDCGQCGAHSTLEFKQQSEDEIHETRRQAVLPVPPR